MTEQEIMDAYLSASRIEIFHYGEWTQAVIKNFQTTSTVPIITGKEIDRIELLILDNNGYPTRQTAIVSHSRFQDLLRSQQKARQEDFGKAIHRICTTPETTREELDNINQAILDMARDVSSE